MRVGVGAPDKQHARAVRTATHSTAKVAHQLRREALLRSSPPRRCKQREHKYWRQLLRDQPARRPLLSSACWVQTHIFTRIDHGTLK